MAETDENVWQKIITSDEAHFTLTGTLNKQNCRFYGIENPQIINEIPLYAHKVTVWCGVCADMIIGPFFFEDEAGETVTCR